jgi:hypothetical protein
MEDTSVEIVFQNKREDFEAFYAYIVKETEQGKKVSRLAFRNWLLWVLTLSMLYGSLAWGWSAKWQTGLIVSILSFLFGCLLNLLARDFKPIYGSGIHLYRRQNASITPKELQVFQLPRTITIDDKWLEVRSSEVVHRWRWRRVDNIGITSNFVFIHVGTCSKERLRIRTKIY